MASAKTICSKSGLAAKLLTSKYLQEATARLNFANFANYSYNRVESIRFKFGPFVPRD